MLKLADARIGLATAIVPPPPDAAFQASPLAVVESAVNTSSSAPTGSLTKVVAFVAVKISAFVYVV